MIETFFADKESRPRSYCYNNTVPPCQDPHLQYSLPPMSQPGMKRNAEGIWRIITLKLFSLQLKNVHFFHPNICCQAPDWTWWMLQNPPMKTQQIRSPWSPDIWGNMKIIPRGPAEGSPTYPPPPSTGRRPRVGSRSRWSSSTTN